MNSTITAILKYSSSLSSVRSLKVPSKFGFKDLTKKNQSKNYSIGQDVGFEKQLLNKSLLHLEFITRFETYLEFKGSKKLPIEFLQEFDDIKRKAQLTTLRSTSKLLENHYVMA